MNIQENLKVITVSFLMISGTLNRTQASELPQSQKVSCDRNMREIYENLKDKSSTLFPSLIKTISKFSLNTQSEFVGCIHYYFCKIDLNNDSNIIRFESLLKISEYVLTSKFSENLTENVKIHIIDAICFHADGRIAKIAGNKFQMNKICQFIINNLYPGGSYIEVFH